MSLRLLKCLYAAWHVIGICFSRSDFKMLTNFLMNKYYNLVIINYDFILLFCYLSNKSLKHYNLRKYFCGSFSKSKPKYRKFSNGSFPFMYCKYFWPRKIIASSITSLSCCIMLKTIRLLALMIINSLVEAWISSKRFVSSRIGSDRLKSTWIDLN